MACLATCYCSTAACGSGVQQTMWALGCHSFGFGQAKPDFEKWELLHPKWDKCCLPLLDQVLPRKFANCPQSWEKDTELQLYMLPYVSIRAVTHQEPHKNGTLVRSQHSLNQT